MKKSSSAIILGLLLAVFCMTKPANATQGFYGYAYSHATIDYLGLHIQANTKNVSNALVYVYDTNNQYVVSTTASICGYYTVNLSPGYYALKVVQKGYYERQINTCNSTNEYETLAGQRSWLLISGFWTQLDLATN